MINFAEGLQIGNAILQELTNNKIADKFNIYVDTFNNCRETGYMLRVSRKIKQGVLLIWMHEERSSDDIMVRWGDENEGNINNMFNDKVYEEQSKNFKEGEIETATKFISKLIRNKLK